jgi:hypothetical protein
MCEIVFILFTPFPTDFAQVLGTNLSACDYSKDFGFLGYG